MSRPINGDDVFRAVAHPVRRRILELLRPGERSMGEIAASFRLSSPTVSQHLRVLDQAGLVSQRRVCGRRIYRLEHTRLKKVQHWTSRIAPAARPSTSKRRSASRPSSAEQRTSRQST